MPSNVFELTRKRKLECHLPYLEYQKETNSKAIYWIKNMKKTTQTPSMYLIQNVRQEKTRVSYTVFYSEYRLRTQLEFPLPYSEYHKEHTVNDNRVVLIPMILVQLSTFELVYFRWSEY